MIRYWASVSTVAATLILSLRFAASFPIYGQQTVLPAGSELNEQSLDEPRQESPTSKSCLINFSKRSSNTFELAA